MIKPKLSPKTDKIIDTILLILAVVCFAYALSVYLYTVIVGLVTALAAALAAVLLMIITLGFILLADDPFGSLSGETDTLWDAALPHILLPLALGILLLAAFLVRIALRRKRAAKLVNTYNEGSIEDENTSEITDS